MKAIALLSESEKLTFDLFAAIVCGIVIRLLNGISFIRNEGELIVGTFF